MSLRALLNATLCTLLVGCPQVTELDGGPGAPPEDAGVTVDAGRDAGRPDAGFDAGQPDAGLTTDAGQGDGGCVYRLQSTGFWSTARPLAIELADMNGDGQLDIVVATTSTLEIRVNDGQGTFATPSALGPMVAQTLAVTDVDGDGFLDVVGVDGAGVLTLAQGNGDGTFGLATRLDAGRPFFVPLDTALADLDGDGHTDFVTLEVGGTIPELRVVRGFFDAGVPRAAVGSHRLLLADVTGDGHIDALVGNAQYGLALHRGDGDGGLVFRADAGELFLASTAVNALALEDVTGDGVPDAVCASGYFDGTVTRGGGVTVVAGRDGGFTAPAIEPSGREIFFGLVMADMNRDGVVDAVSSSVALDAGLEVLVGEGGVLSPLLRVPGRNGWAVAVGDLNADGFPDVALGSGSGSNGEVRVLLGSCQ